MYKVKNLPIPATLPFLKIFLRLNDVLMLMTAGDFRVGLVTEHVPVKDIAGHITKEEL